MVGYDLDDSLKLIDKLLEQDLDFLDLSSAAGGNLSKASSAERIVPEITTGTLPATNFLITKLTGSVKYLIQTSKKKS
jgi:hypothetical protein